MTPVTGKRELARRVCLVCWGLLLTLLSIRVAGIVALQLQTRLALCLLQAAPLIAFAPGLWRGAQRSYVWLCLVLLMYFVMAVERVIRPGAPIAEFLELGLIVVLFVTAMMFSRWQSQALRSAGVEERL